MDLLLVRHAIAEPRSPGLQDALRSLTPAGRERFERCVGGLGRLGIVLDGLYHSPWQRAVETALLMAPVAPCHPVGTALLAGSPTEELLSLADGHAAAALVGHEPWMSDALELCLGTRRAPVAFKKGGVAWLRGEPIPGGFELAAFLPPRVLVKLAR